MNTVRRGLLKLFGVGVAGSTSLESGVAATNRQDDDSEGDDETRDEGEDEDTIDWEAVGEAIGKQGEQKDGGVYKVSFPRTDLDVCTQGVTIEPALALGSWAAFKEVDDGETLVLGDLVLTGEEYNDVIGELQEGGIRQTAIHKHLPDLTTPAWWTHIKGTGDPVEMAETINNALSVTGTPMEDDSGSGAGDLPLDTDRLDEIIGYEGESSDGVYKYSVGLDYSVETEGVEVPSPMGAALPLGFQPVGDGRAAINGDFAMRAEEVNPVLRTLRDHGIEVVSLHNHMLAEEPRLFFAHFWAVDDATRLAEGLRAALDEVDTAR